MTRRQPRSFARALARAAFELPPSPLWRLAPAGGLPGEDELALLGPAEAPIAVIRGRHRFRLLLRAPRSADLQGFIRAHARGRPEAARRDEDRNRHRSAKLFVRRVVW